MDDFSPKEVYRIAISNDVQEETKRKDNPSSSRNSYPIVESSELPAYTVALSRMLSNLPEPEFTSVLNRLKKKL